MLHIIRGPLLVRAMVDHLTRNCSVVLMIRAQIAALLTNHPINCLIRLHQHLFGVVKSLKKIRVGVGECIGEAKRLPAILYFCLILKGQAVVRVSGELVDLRMVKFDVLTLTVLPLAFACFLEDIHAFPVKLVHGTGEVHDAKPIKTTRPVLHDPKVEPMSVASGI